MGKKRSGACWIWVITRGLFRWSRGWHLWSSYFSRNDAPKETVLALNAFPPQSGPANPLAAHPVFLLKDSFDNVLLKNGMRSPAGKTPMQGWDLACQQKSPQCAQALTCLQPFITALVKIDPSSGKATFLGVPAGSYYVFGTTHANRLALSWDVRVDLKSGTNSLVLDQKNAGALQ